MEITDMPNSRNTINSVRELRRGRGASCVPSAFKASRECTALASPNYRRDLIHSTRMMFTESTGGTSGSTDSSPCDAS